MTSPSEEAISALVFHAMWEHHLPWRIEHDWTVEVIAADGHVVAKCMSLDAAQLIIDAALRIKELVKTCSEDDLE